MKPEKPMIIKGGMSKQALTVVALSEGETAITIPPAVMAVTPRAVPTAVIEMKSCI